jgi:NDP-sugar pyrophosphorylase family protein
MRTTSNHIDAHNGKSFCVLYDKKQAWRLSDWSGMSMGQAHDGPPPASGGVRGVLQAGGRGQRLNPATESVPKPLLPVGGVPMIERLLRQFILAGVYDVTIITGWLGHMIRDHLESLADLPAGSRLSFVNEQVPLGNIGGLSELVPTSDTLLFAFADLVTDMRLSDLLEVHRKSGWDATLASHQETYRVSLGELILSDERVVDYLEKPLKSYTICSGVAAFEPHVLSVLERGQPMGISDLITKALAANLRVGHWPHGASILDVNRSDVIEQANAAAWLGSRVGT